MRACVTEQLTLLAGHPRLVAAVAPLVLLHLLQLVVVEPHALLYTLLSCTHEERKKTTTSMIQEQQ